MRDVPPTCLRRSRSWKLVSPISVPSHLRPPVSRLGPLVGISTPSILPHIKQIRSDRRDSPDSLNQPG